MKKFVYFSAGFIVILILFGFTLKSIQIKRISLTYTVRELKKNMSTKTEMEIYYQPSGKMITKFITPFEVILVTNENGEYQMYDPKRNSVSTGHNMMLSSGFTTLGYFLNDQTKDLGLKAMGFNLQSSKVVDGTLVTTWVSPPENLGEVQKIELVHDKNKPIFMGYLNNKNEYLRKSFYYSYYSNNDFLLPGAITEINYLEDGDSTITKSSITNIKINEQANSEYFNFTIPNDAQISK